MVARPRSGQDASVTVSILIVDDHVPFRLRAATVLVADGFQVVGEAGDAMSAVAAVEDLRPDVVLLDIRLPDGSGFDVAARLAEMRDPPGPVVVLISSRGRDDYGSRIDRSPVRGFIAKDELSGRLLQELLDAPV